MTMRKVFWDNPYQTILVTIVSSITNNQIVFKETIAFSFSGGQESDRAYINNLPIIGSEIFGDLIYYTLPDGHGLMQNDVITMEIDWFRRLRLMRLHFAAELILELITQKLGIEKIGAHIAEDKARIDFIYGKNISVIFGELLDNYNEIISANIAIKTGFSDILNQRRYWEIEGFAKVPCGGTHVKSTAEVGGVKLKRVNIGSGKERIEITLIKI
jgi:Ser-tRNA(Ala) deacylase AlaX